MISFQGKTWCNADCSTVDCTKRLTQEVIQLAEVWCGGKDVPISTSDFSEACDEYVKNYTINLDDNEEE